MIRKHVNCKHCGKSLVGLNRFTFCSYYCSHAYKNENKEKICGMIAERIKVLNLIDKYNTYLPFPWEKEEVKTKLKELRKRKDDLDFELGDY